MEVPASTDEALQTVLLKIIARTMKLLTRKGVLVEEQGQTTMADDDADSSILNRPASNQKTDSVGVQARCPGGYLGEERAFEKPVLVGRPGAGRRADAPTRQPLG